MFDAVVESGILAKMRAGSIVSIHSTVHPDTCRSVARIAAGRGVAVTDAPVAGGSTIQTLVINLGLRLNAPPTAAPGRVVEPGKLAARSARSRTYSKHAGRSSRRSAIPFGTWGQSAPVRWPSWSTTFSSTLRPVWPRMRSTWRRGWGSMWTACSTSSPTGAQSLVASLFGPHFRMAIHPEAQKLMRKDIELGVELMKQHALAAPTLVEAARRTADRAAPD